MQLNLDSRTNNSNVDLIFPDSDIKTALQKISLLDGVKHTLLTIENCDKAVLSIGGGNDGQYIVTLDHENGESMTLLNIDGFTIGDIELCAGGQYAEFPKNIVVDQVVAENAIRLFFNNEQNSLKWEVQ